ncbi:hypothetical protein HYV12_01710 [Candidatus Dojkabacteria bacterium]|nr:hypothetical protein [Candidatus Dojkabacteria bacterium]
MKKSVMELSNELTALYRHWEKHINNRNEDRKVILNRDVYERIVKFANERMTIYERKIKGDLPPFSTDKILCNYRFCNIYRELDRQTIAFHRLLKPYENNFSLWLLNMLFCRFICNPGTISKVGLLNFERSNNIKVFKKLSSLSSPKYGVAYIFPISTIQKSKYNTREKFFCYYLPTVIKEIAKEIEAFESISVTEALERLLPIFGFNFKFHFTELLIDTAYQYPDKIDLFKRFPIGPGSLPTMNLLNPTQSPEEVCMSLASTHPNKFNYLTINGKKIPLSAENWEGIGCEFRKYTNLNKGDGRKRLYINK